MKPVVAAMSLLLVAMPALAPPSAVERRCYGSAYP
jgi:hypothetical protein